MAQGVITKKGREKLCKAHAGELSLPPLIHMAFGSGGIDSSNTVIQPTGEETGLREELLKKSLDGYSFPIETTCKYSVRIEKEELANQIISEQGLFDAEGDLIIYKTFLPKGKDEDMEFVFEMDEIF